MYKSRLIINPIAGTRSKEGIGQQAKAILESHGWDVDVFYTRGPGDAARLAKEAVDSGCGAVIGVGGDGTVNEIASAVSDTEAILGIIPCGSGNGLGRHLGISMTPVRAVETILQNNPGNIDYAEVTGKKFFCTCGLGFDAVVSDIFSHKEHRGLGAYLLSVIETYAGYNQERYTLQIDGHNITVAALLIAVCNASQYGNNVHIAPGALIDDGMLDVTVIHSGNFFEMIHMGADLLRKRLDKNLLIQTFRCPRLKIKRESDGLMHIDGEPVKVGKELDLKCVSGGLRVFLPK